MKRAFIFAVVLFTVTVGLSTSQYVSRKWSQNDIQKLIDTTVVALVNNETDEWLGTGVVIDPKGTILTAAHVVTGKGQLTIKIMTSKGVVYFCETLAVDHRRDLAAIRILDSAQHFPYSRLQESKKYYAGQDIIIVGNPHGLFWMVTKGSISRVFFDLNSLTWRFDTDALVNPGNSGGPAFNERGEVIGIVSAMHVTYSGLPVGIGIVVPISEIHRFLRMNSHKINKPWPKPRYRLGDSV